MVNLTHSKWIEFQNIRCVGSITHSSWNKAVGHVSSGDEGTPVEVRR